MTFSSAVLHVLLVGSADAFAAFRSGEPWLDVNGRVIDAHGGGFLVDNGVTYWYGSQRNGWRCCNDGGINLYSSTNLYNWTYEGLVLKSFDGSPTGNGHDLERPKVVRCARTQQFVMWVRGTGKGNTPQLAAVAVSASATGPFTFIGNSTDPFHAIAPGNYQFADATLFQDPKSSKAYLYWRTRVNVQHTGFRAIELTDDCTAVRPETDTQLFQTPNREAPAVFFAHDRYYLWTSGTMGWAPTTMHLYTSDRPLGAFNQSGLNNSKGWLVGWEPPPIPAPGAPGNRKPEQPGEWAFGSQSTFILPNPMYSPGSGLAPFVYMADRWVRGQNSIPALTRGRTRGCTSTFLASRPVHLLTHPAVDPAHSLCNRVPCRIFADARQRLLNGHLCVAPPIHRSSQRLARARCVVRRVATRQRHYAIRWRLKVEETRESGLTGSYDRVDTMYYVLRNATETITVRPGD